MDTLFPDLPTAVHHDEARLRAVVPPRHDDAPETLTRGGERGRIDPARADALLEGLNPAQREAVLHAGSPLLIVAGAGSGKTRVLAHRIAHKLATGQVRAGELGLDAKKFPAKALAGRISTLKDELVDPETYARTSGASSGAANSFDEVLSAVYTRYQARLRQAHALDFDDLIMTTVHLLQAFPAVAEHYRRRFRQVLVDEYQDTNHAQYILVRELVGPVGGEPVPGELTVVGDADQSIYAFRGATIRTILLEQNYRSTQNILSAANAVISRNPGRKPKRLWTAAGAGPQIVGYVAD